MAEIVHFVKMDSTDRTTVSTTPVEITQYTVNFTDLTAAGFAAGDDVIILVATKLLNLSPNQSFLFQVGHGSTYASRTDEGDSLSDEESENDLGKDVGHQYHWMDRQTSLPDGENWFFSLSTTNAGQAASTKDFSVVFLKLGDLGANDFGYDEVTHSGDAPTIYGTTGASFTTGAAGDWLLFAMTRWITDSTSTAFFTAIQADGVDVSELEAEGEDLTDEPIRGTVAYRAGLGSGVVNRVRFRVGDAATHDCVRTKIFGLRLDAFEDHDGVQTTNLITHSVLDTFQEFAGFGAYSKVSTGNIIALALPLHTANESFRKQPYGQIQLGGVDWDIADRNDRAVFSHRITGHYGPFLFGYASEASGTLDWDFDIAERNDVSPTYDCDEQVAAVFSLELAAAPPPSAKTIVTHMAPFT